MESSNLGNLLNATLNAVAGNLSIEVVILAAIGITATVAMRRFQTTLAATRTLQPTAAAGIQRALRPAAVPLAATFHAPLHPEVAASTVPTIGGGDASHAA